MTTKTTENKQTTFEKEEATPKFKIMKLGDQALGNIMLALQRSILQQTDITETLRNFEFVATESGLWIKNPVLVKYDYASEEESAAFEEQQGTS